MIELIVLGSIQGVVWSGILVYKCVKRYVKNKIRDTEVNIETDEYSQELLRAQRQRFQRHEFLPPYTEMVLTCTPPPYTSSILPPPYTEI